MPGVNVIGLIVVLYFAIANVGVITGRNDLAINLTLPLIGLVVFIIGIIVALVLRVRRPETYRKFGQDPEVQQSEDVVA